MWTVFVLTVCLATGLAQDHIGEDSHQDYDGNPLIIMTMGDWGTDSSAQRRVAQSMANYADDNPVDFFLTLGDNFYDGVTSAEDPWWDTRWRDIYLVHESLENQKWYASVGNHDYTPVGEDKEWNQVARHEIDDQWYFPHLWYCLHFENTEAGDVDIFVLDTQAMRLDMNDWRDQLSWLEEELAASTADWKVLAAHHPGYTIGVHSLGSNTVRDHLVPLLEQYDVDMYLTGHDHNLQHLKRSDLEGATDHIIIGGGGRGLYSETDGARDDLESQDGVVVEHFHSTYCFGMITFDQEGMHVDVYDDEDALIYTYTRTH